MIYIEVCEEHFDVSEFRRILSKVRARFFVNSCVFYRSNERSKKENC